MNWSNAYATCPAEPYVFEPSDSGLVEVLLDETGDHRLPYRSDLPFRGGGFTRYRRRAKSKAYTNAGRVSPFFTHCDKTTAAARVTCDNAGNLDFTSADIRAEWLYPPANGWLFMTSG
eukprot:gene14778-17465_t